VGNTDNHGKKPTSKIPDQEEPPSHFFSAAWLTLEQVFPHFGTLSREQLSALHAQLDALAQLEHRNFVSL